MKNLLEYISNQKDHVVIPSFMQIFPYYFPLEEEKGLTYDLVFSIM